MCSTLHSIVIYSNICFPTMYFNIKRSNIKSCPNITFWGGRDSTLILIMITIRVYCIFYDAYIHYTYYNKPYNIIIYCIVRLIFSITCESSCVNSASNANILGAATPTRRLPSLAGGAFGSISVSCLCFLSTDMKLLASAVAAGCSSPAAPLVTLKITLT